MTRATRRTIPSDPAPPGAVVRQRPHVNGEAPAPDRSLPQPDEGELNPSPLIDAKQIAAQLGAAEETARRIMRSGEIPVIALSPRRLRVRQSDLDAYIAAKTRPATRRAQA